MKPADWFLLNLYYYGTYPFRQWRNRREWSAGQAPVMILFYHRVADEEPTDWTCSNATFRRQMRWLKEHFDMISLEEAQRRLQQGANHRPAVHVTFDDGYAENCREALPLLIREQIPCTYFVTFRNIVEGIPFPHDIEAGKHFPPNTIEQLQQLAAAGIEIGAHGRTHIDLGSKLSEEVLRDEIIYAGEELQAVLGRPVRYFAFPFGQPRNLSPAALQMARQAGYEAVCSAHGGFNFPGDNSFLLRRIHGDPEMIRLKNWVTEDPRKLWMHSSENMSPDPSGPIEVHA